MVDFSQLKRQHVSDQDTARYDLFDIDMPGAYLTVAPATRSNKAYNAAMIKQTLPMQRRMAGGKLSAEFLEKYRDDLKPLYAKHVIKGWGNVVDASGADVPFSVENAGAFLEALPNQPFDGLVGFCEDDSNFREDEDTDTEALAKNS